LFKVHPSGLKQKRRKNHYSIIVTTTENK